MNYKIEISFIEKGAIKKIQKRVNTSSVNLAWKAAFGLIPSEKKFGEVKIKVLSL